MHFPILAHTERYTALARHPKAALTLREELGLAFQINSSTIIQHSAFSIQHLRVSRFIKALLKEGALDHIATDSHNVTTRPVRMKEAIAALERQGAETAEIMQRSCELMQQAAP